jgi:ADP-heptose:LPS heptosyltransferase
MQWLDGHAGPALCWLRSLSFRAEKAFPKKIEKILIIKMFGLGSMVVMTPMIRSVRNNYPSAKIFFMTFKGHDDLCRCYKMCDEALLVRRDSFWNFCIDSLKNISRIRSEKIDIIIDAEFFSRYTALLTSFCPQCFIIGFFNRNMYRGKFLDKRCYFNQYYHMKQNFMELANYSCSTYRDFSITVPEISEESSLRIVQLIDKIGFANYPVIIMNPNTSDITPAIDRSWPLENFAKLGQYLLKKGYKIVVIGNSQQRKRSEMLSNMCAEGAVSFAGKINLEELIALIREVFCVITNDSAPLHIAISNNVPTLSFFGTDTPILYGSSDSIHVQFYKHLPCSPCLSIFNYKRGECEFDSACIRNINYQEVVSKFQEKEDLFKEEYYKKTKKIKK